MGRPPPVPGKRSSPAAAKAPHFFKIIHSSVIDDRRLRIPRRFTRKFLNEISDVAVLSVPSGRAWTVQLKKERDEIWLQKGLHEFLEYYSVCVGHLLIFKYEGNSRFYVLIFDMSATEIVYPSGFYDLKKPNLATKSLEPKQIARKNKAVDEFAKKGSRKLNLATESLEPKRIARKNKVIDEFAEKGTRKPNLATESLEPKRIAQKIKVIDEFAEKGRRKLNLAIKSLEPKRIAQKNKVIDEFAEKGTRERYDPQLNPHLKSGKEGSKHTEKVRELVYKKKRSGDEKHKGSEESGLLFKHPCDYNGLKEPSCVKRSLTPAVEDSEGDSSIEILDVFPCHIKVAQKSCSNKLNCPRYQCEQNRHSLRLAAKRIKEKVDFGSRLCELRDGYVIYANGVNFKLPKMKKERVEEVKNARQLVDESKRSQTKSKGNEEVAFVFEHPSEKSNKEQNCGKESLKLTKEDSEGSKSVEILDVSPVKKKNAPRNKEIVKKGNVKCEPQFQQRRYSPRIAANRAKEAVDVGSEFYELRNRSVLRSNSKSSNCSYLCKRRKVQVRDAGKAGQVVDGSKSELKHEDREEFGSISEKFAELDVSESNCSRRASGNSDYQSKKLRGFEDLGLSVHFTGMTRALAAASETDKLKQKRNELFKHFNLKKEIEMYPLNAAFSRNEPTMHTAISMPKSTSENSPCTTQLAGRKGANLADEQKITREFIFASGADVNSFLFHCPNNEYSLFASPKFTSCSDNGDKNLVQSFCYSKFNQNNHELPETEQVEFYYSKERFLSEKSPILRVNQKIQFDKMPFEIIERERNVVAASAFTSENPFCKVVMRPSYVNESSCMNMALDFTRTHLSKDLWSAVMLELAGGRNWHVECFKAENQAMVGKGWREFVLDNHLKEDDVCVFEIIRRDGNELKVAIFRST